MDIHTETNEIEEPMVVDLGDLVALTLGQGKGSSEDKRRAYNHH
ncbi:albusnodin family lasso peptide [Streptomyces xiamenensis]